MNQDIEPTNSDILKAINEFADNVEIRFSGIDKRFDGVEQRLDGVEQRLDGVEQRLDGVEQRLDGVDKRLDGVDKRLDGVDKRLDTIDKRLEKVELGLAEVKTEFIILRNGLDERFSGLRDDIMLVIKKENTKVEELAGAARKTGAVSETDYERVLSMGPFPQVFT